MLKADVLEYLKKIPDDEELFVLRSQDIAAAPTVMDWARRATRLGSPRTKVGEAMACSMRMEKHPRRKVPD